METPYQNSSATSDCDRTLLLKSSPPVVLAERILKVSPVPTLVLDRRQNIIFWNDACEQLTGIDADSAVGSCLWANTLLASNNVALFTALTDSIPETISGNSTSPARGHAAYATTRGRFPALNGKDRYLQIETRPILNEYGQVAGYIKTLIDFTAFKEGHPSLLAENRPSLTEVTDQRLLTDRLNRDLIQAQRNNEGLAIYCIGIGSSGEGLDGQKAVEKSVLLREISERLKVEIRAIDTLAYCGNFKFVIIAASFKHQDHIADLGYRLLSTLSAPLKLTESLMPLCCNIGISVFPEDGADAEALQEAAFLASRKDCDRNNSSLHFYNPLLERQYAQLLTLQTQLSNAIENKELSLHFQPKACLHSGQMSGMEALLRWNNPQLGQVSPADFIPVAERLGLVHELGKWVFQRACEQYADWRQKGLSPPPIAINLSGLQLKDPNFVAFVARTLKKTNVDPASVELEITETAVLVEMITAVNTLRELKRLGLTISLDDFGTGYSSLNYLRQLPIDKIKIDRTFIKDLAKEPGNAEIVKATIGIARALQLKVIAEGVEETGQLNFLQRLGCDEIQGYLFSRPVVGEELGKLLQTRFSLPLEITDAEVKRILVVDDEPAILNCLRRELSGAGYEVETASGPEEAFSLLAEKNCSLVISDYLMPGINGVCFLEKIKKIHPLTVRIAMSGSYDVNMLAENINRGEIFKFIFKPFSNTELLAIVEESFSYLQYRKQSMEQDRAR